METNKQLESSKAHIIIEIIEYVPNAIVSRTIIKKTTGNITATSIASGEVLEIKIFPFDTYVQIIDGVAQITINEKRMTLNLGQGIIIPAHSKHSFAATEKFKMITTVIKSGYEE